MNIFTQHPHSIGESYFKHLFFACLFGIKMLLGGIACVLHGFFPFIFQRTASNITFKLKEEFSKRMAEKN